MSFAPAATTGSATRRELTRPCVHNPVQLSDSFAGCAVILLSYAVIPEVRLSHRTRRTSTFGMLKSRILYYCASHLWGVHSLNHSKDEHQLTSEMNSALCRISQSNQSMDRGTRALGQLLGYPSCIYCNH